VERKAVPQVNGSTMKATTDSPPPAQPVAGGTKTDDLEKIITEHPFLQGLTPHQYRLLTDCAMFTKFQPGELIFREGDPANRFYLLRRGKVALESHLRSRGVIHLQNVGAGEVLGWSWLFPPYYWHFDARAIEPTDAVFFYGTPLRAECEADHDLGYELMRRMAEIVISRLQATRRQLLEATSKTTKDY